MCPLHDALLIEFPAIVYRSFYQYHAFTSTYIRIKGRGGGKPKCGGQQLYEYNKCSLNRSPIVLKSNVNNFIMCMFSQF